MDKIFNFFSKTKTKEEIEKQKRNTIINTQNLQNLANVNLSDSNTNSENKINNNNENNQNNLETFKTINFSSQDFENIDKLINQKQENENDFKKSEIKLTEKDLNLLSEIKTENDLVQASFNQAQNFLFNNNGKNSNALISKQPVGDVVMVNNAENIKKASDGFYTKKYKEQLANLKSVKIHFYFSHKKKLFTKKIIKKNKLKNLINK